MKTLLSFIFVFITIQIYGQNYRTVNTSRTAYYNQVIEWELNNMPFKVDDFSIKNDGDTLVTFLEIFDKTRWYDIQTYPFSCLDTASTPWQGKKSLLKTDGRDIYYNEHNEPITINTQANINESWLMFENDSLRAIATITGINFQSVLGVMDSVKHFSIQVLDSLNNPIIHPLDGETFAISQNFGFVGAPGFHYFPNAPKHNLVGVQSPKMGVYNITRNDIYNFNIGDEFHIQSGTWLETNYYQVFITNKSLDSNGNWMYEYDVAQHLFEKIDSYTGEQEIIEDTSGFVPFELISPNYTDLSQSPMTFYEDNITISGFAQISYGLFNNRIQKHTHLTYWRYNGTDCWEYALLSGSVASNYFEGLGGPYGGIPTFLSSATNLVYYKKGNEIYGTPINFNQLLPTKNIISESENLKIYPNPTQDFINIKLENQSNFDFNILIINNLGKIVQQETIETNTHQIAVNHLPKGIYILRIENNATIYIKRFVKD